MMIRNVYECGFWRNFSLKVMYDWIWERFEKGTKIGFENKMVDFEKTNSFRLKKVRGFESSKKGFESIRLNFKTLDSRKRGFESLKEGFKSPKNILAIGKWIRIA